MKNLRYLVSAVSLFVLGTIPITNAGAGCTADDPGECSDGYPCCVGYSPNCKEDPIHGDWIDCGDGYLYCSDS